MILTDVLFAIKQQLDWRGPNGRGQGHVVLERDVAEFLHRAALELMIERDEFKNKIEIEEGIS